MTRTRNTHICLTASNKNDREKQINKKKRCPKRVYVVHSISILFIIDHFKIYPELIIKNPKCT